MLCTRKRRRRLSIYKQTYKAYTGPLTSPLRRILVLSRYGLAEAWSSKITVGLLILCLMPCLMFLVGIYLANNPLARMLIFKGGGGPTLMIDASYFFQMMKIQGQFALVLCAWVAPRLISFDLADNALPILLSHPISRPGYVLGKMIALVGCLSLVTWVPGLLLFAYQGYASATPWFGANLRLAGGMFAGLLVWIVFLALLGLALSAWVKWRVVATGLIFASVFISAAVGSMIQAILRTKWGELLNLPVVMSSLWNRLLGTPIVARGWQPLPLVPVLLMLTVACAGFLLMLNARIRARGVVRG